MYKIYVQEMQKNAQKKYMHIYIFTMTSVAKYKSVLYLFI